MTAPTHAHKRVLPISLGVALCGLFLLTAAVRSQQLLPGEHWVATHLSNANSGAVGWFAVGIDDSLNDWGAPVVFAALLAPVLWRWGPVALLWYCAAGLSTAVTKLTDLAQRPRPTPDLAWGEYLPGYGGYPSGHVVYVVVLCVVLAALSRRYEGSTGVRRTIVATSAALSIAVGPARLITNDHWGADVVGGYLVAIVILTAGGLLTGGVVGARIEGWILELGGYGPWGQPGVICSSLPSRCTIASSGGASPTPSGSSVKST